MQYIAKNKLNTWVITALVLVAFTACKKDGNPNNLPSVNLSDYDGKIDGFSSSDEVFAQNLVAYWSFEDTRNETKTGAAPTTSVNNAFVAGGVKGKALDFTAGYLYYATQFQKLKTDSLKNWSISLWVKLLNNGAKRTMVMQLARPGLFNGNINFALNTNGYPASNTTTLRINPTFSTNNSLTGGSLQDNLNNVLDQTDLTKWVHLVLTYNYTTGTFNNWMNGVKVGNFPNRGTGGSSFKAWEPSELFIGANYNAAGMPVSADVSFAPMTGSVDEIRMFNIALGDAFISALYNLGKAGK